LTYSDTAGLREEDVLEDIFETSLCIAIRRYIFSESYHLEKAITDASKAAYLSTLIKYNAKNVSKFKDPLELKDWLIEEPMNTKLNKFKKSNPEAFFYWYKIYELSIQIT